MYQNCIKNQSQWGAGTVVGDVISNVPHMFLTTFIMKLMGIIPGGAPPQLLSSFPPQVDLWLHHKTSKIKVAFGFIFVCALFIYP